MNHKYDVTSQDSLGTGVPVGSPVLSVLPSYIHEAPEQILNERMH